MVKASEAVTINVNMGWGWGDGQQASASVAIGTEWAEVEWEYSGIAGTSCNLVAQPGGATATIEWKYLTVGHNAKAQRPTTWQQWLTNDGKSIIPGVETESKYMGDAEFGAWPDWSFETDAEGVNANWRGDRTGEICAWNLTMGKNNDSGMFNGSALDGRARPYPADIEVDATDANNHVFAVHVDKVEKIDDDASIQWSNQFWIQSPQAWKEGSQIRIKFRYRAEKAAKAATQIHKEHPSDYLHWEGVGDVNFSTEWQEFDKTITFNGSQATGWSLAFNLCAESTVDAPQETNVFYFDDLSWETMVLDEGYFVAGCNTTTGLEYDFDNAIECTEDGDGNLVAILGEKGKPDTYVNQIMISTIRGNDAAFKSNTLKPSGAITNDPDNWLDYAPSSIAKLTLPGAGVWKIYIDTDYTAMAFEMLEGEVKDPIDIVTNTTEIVVKGKERDWRGKDNDGNPIEEGGVGEGQPWDNQFWFVANRVLEAGEVTVLEFKYKASKAAKTSTQCHAGPGGYIHWAAIGDVNFTEEWQDFSQDFTVPSECAGKDFKSIAFNMAEIKDACDYEIKDVKWYLKDAINENGKTWENLINETGTENFWVKEGAGTDPYQFGGSSGINNVVVNKTSSAVIYNLAGQRVSKDYKGLVVKEGRKVVVK